MDSLELVTGTVVTLIIGIIMVFSIYRIWRFEDENPTEQITPEE